MELASDKFEIGGILFKWGTTMREVKTKLEEQRRRKFTSEITTNLKTPCAKIFEFPAIECEATAPSFNRPILTVKYRLLKNDSLQFWLTPLKKLLGSPDNFDNNDGRITGVATHYITWNRGDKKFRLYVYHGIETLPIVYTAELYIEWKDEITAAKPYLKENELLESKLFSNANVISNLTKYTLQRNQKHYSNLNSEAENNLSDPRRELLRKLKRALKREGLIETPKIIKNELNDFEFALWRILNSDDWALSTKHDTVIFNGNSKLDIDWQNTLPAKGAGTMYFSLNHFSIYDDPSSEEIKRMVRDLEKIIGEKIEYTEDYDC